ncbi:isochorismate synthase [Mumia flava]|uniref:isochorismate synthase n=1 Tax=Mumia flava TaxID=1348852 RepID=A0A2M9BK70_9ACTN|nr:isochorismate synthase [Mumia flava]PJJ58336.1 isochorismate synthase [Mumia flava]
MTRPEPQHQAARQERDTTPTAVFGSLGGFLVGHGRADLVTSARSDDPTLPARVGARLRARAADGGGLVPTALGTLSFRHDRPAAFVVPAHLERVDAVTLTERMDDGGCARPGAFDGAPRALVEHLLPDDAAYRSAVRSVLDELDEPRCGRDGPARDGGLRKVVLGRWLDVVTAPRVTATALLSRLVRRAGHAYAYLLSPDAVAGSDATLVGASPELLVSRRGRTVRSVPLAGSAPRSDDPGEDRRRAEALVRSAKDRHEHAFVVDAIAEALGGPCRALDVPASPHLIATDRMWHLATDIRGELAAGASAAPCALTLAQLLHPTPAVCGTPRHLAADAIERLEHQERGVMTGATGWVDARGDGEFALTIRSALIDGDLARLYAGAGIVAGSEPAREADETAAKLRTVRDALEAAR